MSERYEMMKVEFSWLPEELKVPIHASYLGEEILRRFYEPNSDVSVPRDEINPDSKRGQFRSPEFCYGFKVPVDDGKPTIIGSHEKLDHILNLMAGYNVSRNLGNELVKLLVAQKFTEFYKQEVEKGDQEAVEMIAGIDNAVEKAWQATINS